MYAPKVLGSQSSLAPSDTSFPTIKALQIIEITFYLAIMFFALWMWSKKPSNSKVIKAKEAKAKIRLDLFFNKLTDEEKSYRLLLKVNKLFNSGDWKPISKEEFEFRVMQDCVRPTGVSRYISDARLSLSICAKSQSIYCVIGIDNFNFTKFHNKQKQKKPSGKTF